MPVFCFACVCVLFNKDQSYSHQRTPTTPLTSHCKKKRKKKVNSIESRNLLLKKINFFF